MGLFIKEEKLKPFTSAFLHYIIKLKTSKEGGEKDGHTERTASRRNKDKGVRIDESNESTGEQETK